MNALTEKENKILKSILDWAKKGHHEGFYYLGVMTAQFSYYNRYFKNETSKEAKKSFADNITAALGTMIDLPTDVFENLYDHIKDMIHNET